MGGALPQELCHRHRGSRCSCRGIRFEVIFSMKILRSIIVFLSRKIVLRRRLPAHLGGETIFVSPGVALKFWRLNLEKIDPSLFGNVLELVKNGDVVWDVGSSVGLFTFSSAILAGPWGKVLSIDPDMWSANLQCRSLRIMSKNMSPIDVLPIAISDSVGLTELMIAKGGRASSFIKESCGSSQAPGIFGSVLVMTATLDWLLDRYPAPNVLKIDVEGAEERVLMGGKKVLSTIRPRILCEIHPENNAGVTRILKESGYGLYNAEIDPIKRKPLDSAAFNTIAYPL